MIQIYTGDGKGKTTAALGLALRGLGAGKKVALVQFLKKPKFSEHQAIENYKLPIDVFAYGIGFYKILGDKHTDAEHKKAASDALTKSAEIISSKKYDLIILDEICVAIKLGLIDVDDVTKMLKAQSGKLKTEIILTGRGANKKLIEMADLVTIMKNRKHYFDKGAKARKGIEL